MYDWLTNAAEARDSHIVTANRRLARTLHAVYAENRVAAGHAGWRRPIIVPASAWFSILSERLQPRSDRPARITPQHSRLLWEQCLRADLDDPMLNMASLARQSLDTWNRLHDWCVPLDECLAEANGQDQRIFARAAVRYQDRLRAEGWIDDAVFRSSLASWLAADEASPPARITLAGFDRVTPMLSGLLALLEQSGSDLGRVPVASGNEIDTRRFSNTDSELRAAGAWARRRLAERPDARVAVVINALEQNSERAGRLLREGATPGWQYSGPEHRDAVNISYGRRLADYPAVTIALLALRWLSKPLSAEQVSLLLRSPLIGHGELSGRSRLEARLRDYPDRSWTRDRVIGAFGKAAETSGCERWLADWQGEAEHLDSLPTHQRPRVWAEYFDEVLNRLSWTGSDSLTSVDFQLVNRWRELISEFAGLETVVAEMSIVDATERLATMAAETQFQPESTSPAIDVLGPLEAAGLEFDGLWIAGLTAADWPPPGRPLPLLSKSLQKRYEMPDATPEDTVNHAASLLERLCSSAPECIASYPATIGDAEQMPTAAIAGESRPETDDDAGDPGWHAASMLGSRALENADDPVPPVGPGEAIPGGARTLDLQVQHPFAAFASGRLDVRPLWPFRSGIGPDLRGNLIHAGLQRLYAGRPDHATIAGWDATERAARIDRAVNGAFGPHLRFADSTLRELLRLERKRTALLLDGVVSLDCDRNEFTVDTVERSLDALIGPLRLSLRCDRIDRLADGSVVILDYKSSRSQKFMSSGTPNDLQLLVYATATEASVSGLGLYRVDSARIEIDGAGPAFGSADGWDETLRAWCDDVVAAAQAFARGDLRLNVHQRVAEARPFNLLSRFTELTRYE